MWRQCFQRHRGPVDDAGFFVFIGKKRDRRRLQGIADQTTNATKAGHDPRVNRLRADEEQAFPAQRFTLQHLALIDQLGKDALIDVFPVQAGSGRRVCAFRREQGFSTVAIVARCVDGLNFNGDELFQFAIC